MNSHQDESDKRVTLRVPGELHKRFEIARKSRGQTLTSFFLEAGKQLADLSQDGSDPVAEKRGPVSILLDLDGFSRQEGLINIEAIENEIPDGSRLIARKSFSTSENNAIQSSKKILLDKGWTHTEKSTHESVRMEIALAALKMAEENSVDYLMIVTNDNELGRIVIEHIKSRSLQVIGILLSQESSTSPDLIRAFDDFRFYDKLDQPLESDELAEQRDRYARSLTHETYKIIKMGRKAVGAQLKPFMERQHPEFYPGLIGYRGLKDLALFAKDRDYVVMEDSGQDFSLKLTDDGQAVAMELEHDKQISQAQEAEINAMQERIRQFIHIELPPNDTRQLIFTTLSRIIKDHDTQDGIELVQLSYRIEERLARAMIPQNTIYRLLNGLFRAGALGFVINNNNRNNPLILSMAIRENQLDDAFILNLISQSELQDLGSPESMSRTFYGDSDNKKKVADIARLATPNFNRGELATILNKMDVK